MTHFRSNDERESARQIYQLLEVAARLARDSGLTHFEEYLEKGRAEIREAMSEDRIGHTLGPQL